MKGEEMAKYFDEPSRTFNEYLLVPGYSSADCRVENVSLRTPVTKFGRGEKAKITMNIPMTSAIMQSVSGDELAIARAKEGGISAIGQETSIFNKSNDSKEAFLARATVALGSMFAVLAIVLTIVISLIK